MNNKQVAQRFAEGSIKGTGSNMFIDGQTVYSYGYHFPIARHIGAYYTLFNASRYSSSTAKHKCHVWRALYKENKTIIEAPDCAIEKAEDYIKGKIAEAVAKGKRAKTFSSINLWLQQAQEYQKMLKNLKDLRGSN